MHIERLVIVGVGLIGGSLAAALRRAGVVKTIVGVGRSRENLAQAQSLGLIDASMPLAEAIAGADVIVLAVPVGAMTEIFPLLTKTSATITDVGSVKACVVADARAALGANARRFVPAHPIAGTEQSGAKAARADLFVDRQVILTPNADTDAASHARVGALWTAAGARLTEMDAATHDEIFALTSHLPHLLAYSLVNLLANARDIALPAGTDSLFDFAASGFRDFTRIAGSDPTMWRDICLANREPIAAGLKRYADSLAQLGAAVERGDATALHELFTVAKRARDAFARGAAA